MVKKEMNVGHDKEVSSGGIYNVDSTNENKAI